MVFKSGTRCPPGVLCLTPGVLTFLILVAVIVLGAILLVNKNPVTPAEESYSRPPHPPTLQSKLLQEAGMIAIRGLPNHCVSGRRHPIVLLVVESLHLDLRHKDFPINISPSDLLKHLKDKHCLCMDDAQLVAVTGITIIRERIHIIPYLSLFATRIAIVKIVLAVMNFSMVNRFARWMERVAKFNSTSLMVPPTFLGVCRRIHARGYNRARYF